MHSFSTATFFMCVNTGHEERGLIQQLTLLWTSHASLVESFQEGTYPMQDILVLLMLACILMRVERNHCLDSSSVYVSTLQGG